MASKHLWANEEKLDVDSIDIPDTWASLSRTDGVDESSICTYFRTFFLLIAIHVYLSSNMSERQ